MLPRVAGVVAAIGVLAAGCGPSGKELARARNATYTCSYEQIFKAVVAEVDDTAPPLGAADPARGIVISEFRWHSKDGARRTSGSAIVASDDVQFQVTVLLQKQENGWGVLAEPRVIGQTAGGPRGRKLTRADGDWPSWADSKTDAIVYGIYERLSSCAVAGGANTAGH